MTYHIMTGHNKINDRIFANPASDIRKPLKKTTKSRPMRHSITRMGTPIRHLVPQMRRALPKTLAKYTVIKTLTDH